MKSNLKRTGFIFSCVAPAVILFTIFMLVPTFNVFRLSRAEGLVIRRDFAPQIPVQLVAHLRLVVQTGQQRDIVRRAEARNIHPDLS